MALDGPETNLHIVYASSIIDQHKEEVFEQYDFCGPRSCRARWRSRLASTRRPPRGAARGTGWWPGSRASRRSPRRALRSPAAPWRPRTLPSSHPTCRSDDRAPPRCGAPRNSRCGVVHGPSSPSSTTSGRSASSSTPSTRARAGGHHLRRGGHPRRRRAVGANVCLLKSVGGGDIDLADLATDASIAAADLHGFGSAASSSPAPHRRAARLHTPVAAGSPRRPSPPLLARVPVEALTGVTVAASTDKTGGRRTQRLTREMETHGLNVAKDYLASTRRGADLGRLRSSPRPIARLLAAGLGLALRFQSGSPRALRWRPFRTPLDHRPARTRRCECHSTRRSLVAPGACTARVDGGRAGHGSRARWSVGGAASAVCGSELARKLTAASAGSPRSRRRAARRARTSPARFRRLTVSTRPIA